MYKLGPQILQSRGLRWLSAALFIMPSFNNLEIIRIYSRLRLKGSQVNLFLRLVGLTFPRIYKTELQFGLEWIKFLNLCYSFYCIFRLIHTLSAFVQNLTRKLEIFFEILLNFFSSIVYISSWFRPSCTETIYTLPIRKLQKYFVQPQYNIPLYLAYLYIQASFY